MESAGKLLTEFQVRGDIDAWDLDILDSMVAVAWGVKLIADQLTGRVVEITLDATCEHKWTLSFILSLKQIIQTKLSSSSMECWERLTVLASHLHTASSLQHHL